MTADLLAQYASEPGSPRMPATEPTLSPNLHRRDEGVESVGHGEDVDSVYVLENLEIFVELRLHAVRDPRAGDDNRGASRKTLKDSGGPDHVVPIRNVRPDRVIARGIAGEGFDEFLKFLCVAADQSECGPPGGEFVGECRAYAAGGAREENVQHDEPA